MNYESYRSSVFSRLKCAHGWGKCYASIEQAEQHEHLITDAFQMGMSVMELTDYLAADLGLVAPRVLVWRYENWPGYGIRRRGVFVCPAKEAARAA